MPDSRSISETPSPGWDVEDDEYVKSLMSLVQNTARGLQETTSKMLANMHRLRRGCDGCAHHAGDGPPGRQRRAAETTDGGAELVARSGHPGAGCEQHTGGRVVPGHRHREGEDDTGLHCLCHMIGVARELSARLDKETDDGDGKQSEEDADDDMEEDGDVEGEEEEEGVDEDEDEGDEEEEEEEEEEE